MLSAGEFLMTTNRFEAPKVQSLWSKPVRSLHWYGTVPWETGDGNSSHTAQAHSFPAALFLDTTTWTPVIGPCHITMMRGSLVRRATQLPGSLSLWG